jgi:putative transposase
MTVTQMVKLVKSITAKKIFLAHPKIKKELWGGNLWTSGYYENTVGQYANEDVIKNYVVHQGKKYRRLHRGQLEFDFGC